MSVVVSMADDGDISVCKPGDETPLTVEPFAVVASTVDL